MYWNEKTGKWSTVQPRVPGQPRKKPVPKPPRKRWLTRWWGPEPHIKPYCTCAEGEEWRSDWAWHRWSRHDDTGACEMLECDCTSYHPSAERPKDQPNLGVECEPEAEDRFRTRKELGIEDED